VAGVTEVGIVYGEGLPQGLALVSLPAAAIAAVMVGLAVVLTRSPVTVPVRVRGARVDDVSSTGGIERSVDGSPRETPYRALRAGLLPMVVLRMRSVAAVVLRNVTLIASFEGCVGGDS
jgi:hypothetical protein